MALSDIQFAINNTPVDGVCDFNGAVETVPQHSEVIVPHGMKVADLTVNVPGTEVPTKSFFNADNIPGTSRLEFLKTNLNGPDCSTWDQNTECNKAAISWSYYKTWGGTLIVDQCNITGGYGTGVLRSGGGRFEVKNSNLSGWVDGIAFFESHGGWGDLILRDTTLHAPANSKYSSIGMYIHPHLHLNAERVVGSGWNRYLIYLNGNPQSAGHHTLTKCVATDCSLIQTGSSSVTTLIRCEETGQPKNGGSYFKGPVLSVDSVWSGRGMGGFLTNNPVDRTFVRDIFTKPSNIAFAASTNVSGTMNFIDCDVQLSGSSKFLKLSNGCSVVANINSTTFSGSATGFAVNIEGGTLNVINATLPPNSRAAYTGVINYI